MHKCLLFASWLFSAACTASQEAHKTPEAAVVQAPASPAISEETLAERREIFETVWSRINEKHFDPKFNGVDWNEVKTRYAPQIETARDDDAFYALLNQMLGELKQTHLGISGPGSSRGKAEETPAHSGGTARVGIVLGLIENQPTVVRLVSDSQAAKAGVKIGWSLLKVDGRAVPQPQPPAKGESAGIEGIYRLRKIQGMLQGKPGSPAALEFDDGKGHRELTLEREALPIEMGTMLGFPIEVEFESRTVDGVGYVRFSPFTMDLLPRIQSAIRSFRKAEGIVIDLRGNPGGIGLMVAPIAAMFLREKVDLGTMLLREGEMRFPVFPRNNPFDGPIAVLIDGGSASTSEVFAGSLQELDRVIVVGGHSAGAVLPSTLEQLPNGAMLQYVVADYRTPKGVYLEGTGVTPNREVEPRRKDLLEGRDPALDAAVEEIKKRIRQKEKL